MLQDIAPHTYHVEFTPAEPQPADLLLIYGPQGVLSAADALRLPRRADFPDIAVHFAFRLDDRAVFLAREPVEAPEGWRYVPSVTYRDAEPRETAFACATGESLQRWYAANRFCGRCGALMTENPAERAMTCPVCHKNVYPRINPAVIVAVLDHGRLLMTKYANRPLIRRYALIAGFCEIGESFEDTVRREVMEEVGLRVKNLRFYKSQPWVLTDSLLLGFFCDVDGDMALGLSDMDICELITPAYLASNLSLLNNAQVIVADTNIPAESLQYLVTHCTPPVFVDPVSTAKARKVQPVLGRVHTLKPNRIEAELLSGVQITDEASLRLAASRLLETGLHRVFISLGTQGVFAADQKEMLMQPCIPAQMRNATGAGDAFMAALAWAYLEGTALAETARAAAAAAAIAIEGEETINPAMSADAVRSRMAAI